ncbi:MAG: DUF1501 domain-containing protein, partial [Mucilaginibacter polytrichastri]|nr:DUF1501 domain-containing protein [Mucilaginibacter polytrichastri]
VYMVSIGSFDTHAKQVYENAKETGEHATLLMKTSDAIKAFMDDLKYLRVSQRVAGMTFSEFGRRIKSNASLGTDHGTAAPMFVFGDYVQKGVLGTSPQISTSTTVNDNLPMQYDFRSVYATMLKTWFCVPDETLNRVMLQNFQDLPLFKTSTPCVSGDLQAVNAASGENLISNYPNPFQHSTTITYKSKGGRVLIQVFDVQGRLIKTLVNGDKAEGSYSVTLENENFRPGVYYARLQNDALQQVRSMVVVR